jgi:hypothetical protein
MQYTESMLLSAGVGVVIYLGWKASKISSDVVNNVKDTTVNANNAIEDLYYSIRKSVFGTPSIKEPFKKSDGSTTSDEDAAAYGTSPAVIVPTAPSPVYEVPNIDYYSSLQYMDTEGAAGRMRALSQTASPDALA